MPCSGQESRITCITVGSPQRSDSSATWWGSFVETGSKRRFMCERTGRWTLADSLPSDRGPRVGMDKHGPGDSGRARADLFAAVNGVRRQPAVGGKGRLEPRERPARAVCRER